MSRSSKEGEVWYILETVGTEAHNCSLVITQHISPLASRVPLESAALYCTTAHPSAMCAIYSLVYIKSIVLGHSFCSTDLAVGYSTCICKKRSIRNHSLFLIKSVQTNRIQPSPFCLEHCLHRTCWSRRLGLQAASQVEAGIAKLRLLH